MRIALNGGLQRGLFRDCSYILPCGKRKYRSIDIVKIWLKGKVLTNKQQRGEWTDLRYILPHGKGKYRSIDIIKIGIKKKTALDNVEQKNLWTNGLKFNIC